jgi:hypothetical protein
VNAITNLLSSIEVGEPITSGSMFMFPLHGTNLASVAPITLDEALGADALLVEEISNDGSVPELIVQNSSDRSVFLLDGEQVLGLKQNRTFNLSMLLQPRSRTVVPVSCLERGRWSARRGKASGAEHVHFATGRANKMRSVTDSLKQVRSYRSDQGRVWSDIDDKFQRADDASSSTAAEADYYEARRARVLPLVDAFAPQPRQVGAAIGIGSKVVGLDIFATAALYASLSEKLLKSYLLDAVDTAAEAAPPGKEAVKAQLERLFMSPASRFPAPGCGETIRWTTLEGAGAALVAEGECIHAMAFSDA